MLGRLTRNVFTPLLKRKIVRWSAVGELRIPACLRSPVGKLLDGNRCADRRVRNGPQ